MKDEHDATSQERSKELKKELHNLEEKYATMIATWEKERDLLEHTRSIRHKLDEARQEERTSKRGGNLEKAARLRYGDIPRLEKDLQESEKHQTSIVREIVDEAEVSSLVARWTGIPQERMLAGDHKRFVKMEDYLQKKVIGQQKAILPVVNAIRRSKSGLRDISRPVSSFLFVGPTGVGKTELCKCLATFLFDDKQTFFRLNMSEYVGKHSISRLIGSPPGYVGYEQGGALTERVRHRPYQVILFDEIEKAHPDVLNILLQIFDDGRLSDGKGRVVDFRHTIIIMTSNLGTRYFQSSQKDKDEKILTEIRHFFRPEFYNRIDEVVMFHCLTLKDVEAIVEIHIQRLQKRLNKNKVTLRIDDEAKKFLAREGESRDYGARPLQRVFRCHIEDPLALQLLNGALPAQSTVLFHYNKNRDEEDKVLPFRKFIKGEPYNEERLSLEIQPLKKSPSPKTTDKPHPIS